LPSRRPARACRKASRDKIAAALGITPNSWRFQRPKLQSWSVNLGSILFGVDSGFKQGFINNYQKHSAEVPPAFAVRVCRRQNHHKQGF
jgi:predicted PhzF superfamily epimerase YddE/YHI9